MAHGRNIEMETNGKDRGGAKTRGKTHRSLDIGERLAGGKSGCGQLDGLGDGDDLGTINETVGVLSNCRELDHRLLELSDHACVIGYEGIVRRFS